MNTKRISTPALVLAVVIFLAACAPSATQAPAATPSPILFATEILPVISSPTASISTPVVDTAVPTTGAETASAPVTTSTTAPVSSAEFCNDSKVTALIDSLKKAITTNDGALLSSLVSPSSGMDVAFYHNGTVVNYDQEHAKFVFETTYEADWGAQPASGEEKVGSFHDVVVPELVKSFNQQYTLYCNEVKHGGASYPVTFPYKKDYYSMYYPGTDANGNMDWHTWVVGIEYVSGKPYIYALTQFFWEP